MGLVTEQLPVYFGGCPPTEITQCGTSQFKKDDEKLAMSSRSCQGYQRHRAEDL